MLIANTKYKYIHTYIHMVVNTMKKVVHLRNMVLCNTLYQSAPNAFWVYIFNDIPVLRMCNTGILSTSALGLTRLPGLGESIVRVSNSWDPNETPRNSASHSDPRCLTMLFTRCVHKIRRQE